MNIQVTDWMPLNGFWQQPLKHDLERFERDGIKAWIEIRGERPMREMALFRENGE